jgi:hypothetical protein
MENFLSMNQSQRDCLAIFQQIKNKHLSIKEAADILDLSYRHCRRKFKRFLALGDVSLIHASRGKSSHRTLAPDLIQRILDLYQCDLYADFGPTLFAEKLALLDIHIDHETLRRLLLKHGLWQLRRKRHPHRSQRPRRSHFGELLQMDGSHHDWFEQRAPRCCLMNLVDDATGITLASLAEEETTQAAMLLLWQWIERYGIPAAIYTDKKSLYVSPTDPAQEATQFGRACQQLGIRIIRAHSPQAKGGVERSHAVYQDRLVKEFRLRQIASVEQGNGLLKEEFIKQLNERFARQAKQASDYHRSLEGYDLKAIFSLEQERKVSQDWLVRYGNETYRLKPLSGYSPSQGRVLVKQYLDGSLHFVYRGSELGYEKISEEEKQKEKKVNPSRKASKPSAKHPWRKAWSSKAVALPVSPSAKAEDISMELK